MGVRGGTRQAATGIPQPPMEALSARAAGENFPVAMRILPRRYRRHLLAVYRFARLVDDIGDEPRAGEARAGEAQAGEDVADRLRMLDLVEQDLDRAFGPDQAATLPVVAELGRTAAECGIPAQPFRMLIEANRQDQTVSRYATFGELLGYCRLSANPVGQAVLHIFGVHTADRARLSDLVCTALQLAEHWQDVAEDFARDRVYLPQEDMAAFGCTEADLRKAANQANHRNQRNHVNQRNQASQPNPDDRDAARTVPAHLGELLAFETERARRLLDEGAALTGTLRGWARLAVAGYVAGGRATLAAITAAGAVGSGRRTGGETGRPAGFDVFGATPRPGRAKTAVELVRAWWAGR